MSAELQARIDAVRRAIARRTLIGVAARAVAILALALLLLASLDALRPMGIPLLTIVSMGWIVAAIGASAWALVAARRASLSRHATARLIEERAGEESNRIINALMFEESSGTHDARAPLAQRAIDRGVEQMARCDPGELLRPESRAARRGIVCLMAAGIVAFAAWGLWPRALAASLRRLAQPTADHPPYSLTEYELMVNPARPMLAGDAEVIARTRGVTDGALRLLIRDEAGRERHVPMAAGEQPETWIARLRSLDRPLRIRAMGDSGWSEWLSLVPDDSFRVLEQEITIEPPSYSGRPARVMSPQDGAAEIDAHEGSLLHLRMKTSGAVRDAGITVEPSGSTVVDASAASDVLSARLGPIGLRPFDVRAHVTSARDGAHAEGALLHIRPLADAPPTLALRRPSWNGEVLIAPVRSVLSFEAEAADDLGLSVVGVSYAVFDARGVWRSTSEVMRIARDEPPRLCRSSEPIEFGASIDVESVGGEPGGWLSVVLLAADSRDAARGGPQRAGIGPVIVQLTGESLTPSEPGSQEDWISAGSDAPGAASRASTARAAGSAGAEPGGQPMIAGAERLGGGAASASGAAGAGAAGAADPDKPEVAPDEPGLARSVGSSEAEWRPFSGVSIGGGGTPQVPAEYRDVAARYFRVLREREAER